MSEVNYPSSAMRGLATGNRAGKPAEREQQIHTPDCILDICESVWGSISLDPCASPEHDTRAAESYYGATVNGLTAPWQKGTYVNPPYKELKRWLAKSRQEAVEQILLFPVRTNRSWWCEYMRSTLITVAWLKPLKFHGYKSAFPAPLVLVYYNKGVNDAAFFDAVTRSGIAHHIGGGL